MNIEIECQEEQCKYWEGACMIRSITLTRPSSWRGWDCAEYEEKEPPEEEDEGE